jgi:hypothetical protein
MYGACVLSAVAGHAFLGAAQSNTNRLYKRSELCLRLPADICSDYFAQDGQQYISAKSGLVRCFLVMEVAKHFTVVEERREKYNRRVPPSLSAGKSVSAHATADCRGSSRSSLGTGKLLPSKCSLEPPTS